MLLIKDNHLDCFLYEWLEVLLQKSYSLLDIHEPLFYNMFYNYYLTRTRKRDASLGQFEYALVTTETLQSV